MFKRALDLCGCVTGIILLSPVLIAISIAIKSGSKGDVLFVQERLGLKGKPFKMFKFRSMVKDAEALGTGLFSFEGDPRVTRIGRLIRKTSLDELPQLFNVLGGSMSLVGPRPPVVYELGDWKDYTPHMRRRFDVKPGITGLAQISGRNELEWDDKIILDNQYVEEFEKRGAIVDLVVLFRTIWVVVRGRGTVEDVKKTSAPMGEVAGKAALAKKPQNAPEVQE